MRYIKLLFIFILIIFYPIKSLPDDVLIDQLYKGGKIIFIRHAYAPGNGDPKHFDLKDCYTQRNLNKRGIKQSYKIRSFFKNNSIPIDNVYSSQWCRCKDTASIIFDEFIEMPFLNSFYDTRFKKNKARQVKNLKKFIQRWNGKKNLVFVTHYVVISEVLKTYPSSGEIVISDKKYNVLGSLNITY